MSAVRSFLLTLTTVIGMAAAVHAADGVVLTGRVRDTGGRPVAGAMVSLGADGEGVRTVTGGDGTFSLRVPAGLPFPATLRVEAPGFEGIALTVEEPGRPVEVLLVPRATFSDSVEVTAGRATAGETPVTFSNVTREQIDRNYWGQDVPMLLTVVPGFYATNDSGNGIGYSYFTLRGFDMRRTSVQLNGVPLNDAESHGVFFIDLADFLATTGDIQVQRGVGLNAYGTSAIGGTVDLRTREPLAERRLRFSFLGGSWGVRRLTLEYDTGLSEDGWAATFRFSKVDSDGYRDRSWVEMWNYFGTVRHVGDRSVLTLTLFGGPEKTHLAYYGVPKASLEGGITGDRRKDRRHNPLTYPQEIDSFFQPHYQLHHSWQAGPDLVLENTLYFFQGDGYFKQYKSDRWMPEYALPPYELPDGTPVTRTDLVRKRSVDEWDAGWIGQAVWRHLDGRGSLRGGLALRLHQGHHWGEVVWAENYPPGLPPNQRYYDYRVDKRTVQPFVEETVNLGGNLTLMGGLTWTTHRYELGKDRRNGVAFSESYTFVLPRLGLTWRAAPGFSVFANVSRGAREPAFRDIYDPQDYWSRRVDLDPEKLTDWELGAEHRWDTGFARLNLYWMHFANEIVWAGSLDDSGVPVTANGARSNHRGVELEAGWTPVPRWGGRLALSWSRNTFSRFVEYGWDGEPLDHSGNRIAGAPDWLASLQFTGGAGPVDGLLTLRYVGEFFLDNTEDLRKDPAARREPGYIHRTNDDFLTVDLALRADLGAAAARALAARRLLLDLRIDNLLDELYTTFGYMDWTEPAWIPAATRSVYAGITLEW